MTTNPRDLRPPLTRSEGRQRRAGAAVLALLAALALALTGLPADAAPRSSAEYLIAADPSAQTIYAYRTSDLKRTGTLEGVELGKHVAPSSCPTGAWS